MKSNSWITNENMIWKLWKAYINMYSCIRTCRNVYSNEYLTAQTTEHPYANMLVIENTSNEDVQHNDLIWYTTPYIRQSIARGVGRSYTRAIPKMFVLFVKRYLILTGRKITLEWRGTQFRIEKETVNELLWMRQDFSRRVSNVISTNTDPGRENPLTSENSSKF